MSERPLHRYTDEESWSASTNSSAVATKPG